MYGGIFGPDMGAFPDPPRAIRGTHGDGDLTWSVVKDEPTACQNFARLRCAVVPVDVPEGKRRSQTHTHTDIYTDIYTDRPPYSNSIVDKRFPLASLRNIA